MSSLSLLMLSRYGRNGASSRLRLFQYAPYLEKSGWSVRQAPLLHQDYLEQLYDGKSVTITAATSYLARLRQLLDSSQFDLLWIEKEALPWVPWLMERALLPRRIPVVSDYDDAVFHRYDLHNSPLVRRVLGRKVDKLMKHSASVLAGNPYLAERARSAGADRIEIVPTVVDLNSYVAQPAKGPAKQIGWIGTPSTWKEYMSPMMPFLGSIAAAHGVRIMAVGAGQDADPHPLLDVVPWSEESEVAKIHAMTVGVMPLTDTPWSRGKCGYKLIQYMACGLPVVASPVGVNADIVEHGVNGFLATSEAEWRSALGTLLADPGLRRRMGVAGRQKIERDYSLQIWGPRVASLLRDVVSRANSH